MDNVNDLHERGLKKSEKLALWITNRVGTMQFFGIIFTWTLIWLGWNSLAPKNFVFDPVPSCVFWLFISNMIQIFLMPLIMIGQNLQSSHSEKLAESHFELSEKMSDEIKSLHEHLHFTNKKLREISEKINKL